MLGMTDGVESGGEGRKVKRAAPGHCSNFKHLDVSAHYINKLIAELIQDDTPTNVAMLFGNRASVNTIRSWRNGNRTIAPWAIEMLKAKSAAVSSAVAMLKPGPGKSAGWRNLPGYMANR